jgi:hypothetical protein
LTFPKTCFNPTCKCKELKIVREIILRCSNCHCGVKIEQLPINDEDVEDVFDNRVLGELGNLMFTVIKNGKDSA